MHTRTPFCFLSNEQLAKQEQLVTDDQQRFDLHLVIIRMAMKNENSTMKFETFTAFLLYHLLTPLCPLEFSRFHLADSYSNVSDFVR
jgi:hypothetical protein